MAYRWMKCGPPRRKVNAGGLRLALIAVAGTATFAASGLPGWVQGAGAATVHSDAVTATLRWTKTFGCPNQSPSTCGVLRGSPTVASLDGQKDVVVGGQDGAVYALHLADGSSLAGWPVQTNHPILSTPGIDPTTGNVFVDAGYDKSSGGGYYSFDPAGHTRFVFAPSDKTGAVASVSASPTIGDINGDGVADVTAPGLNLAGWSVSVNGAVNPGWPREQTDTAASTPAQVSIANANDVVMGGGATNGPGGLIPNFQGGVMQGVDGHGNVLWTHLLNEGVDSSPAVSSVGGQTLIAAGTGDYWSKTDKRLYSDATLVYLYDTHGNVVRTLSTNNTGYTSPSPTWADVLGNGHPAVIEATWGGPGAGYLSNGCAMGDVYAWDPGTGAALPGSPFALPGVSGSNEGGICNAKGPAGPGDPGGIDTGGGGTLGQVVTADFNGDGAQDLAVAGGNGISLYDVKDNVALATLGFASATYQNSPAVVDNGDGTVDVIGAGTNKANQAVVSDWQIIPAAGARGSVSAASWPQFGHDARLTGSTLSPPFSTSFCTPANSPGYWEIAADGGVFAWCSRFYGSIGGHVLNRPVVGGSAAPNRQGYWEVASDGGIFAFGSAGFFGSTGGLKLNQPIVAMVPTASGQGYWLVASDGGIFAYGDAGFYGSTGNLKLNRPIVGMAPAHDGRGYWLVASDGGIFAFGSAAFHGSTGNLKLNRPIVSMTATASGNGYLMAASDGGIFAFGDAAFYGSTGNMKLNQPIVGMSAPSGGGGYWLVASDGGIFAFGSAPFSGSAGNLPLVAPVAGILDAR